MDVKGKVTLEQVLQHVGEFGRFQKILDLLLLTLNFPIALQIFSTFFTTLTPTWVCVPGSSHCTYNTTQLGTDQRRCHMPRSEWIYTEAKQYSLVTDLDLQCDKAWMLQLVSSVYFIGWGTGGIVLGWLGDKFGRKTVLFPSVIATLVIGFATAFLNNIYMITAARFMLGFFNPGGTIQGFILISEYVGDEQRPLASIIVYLCFPLSYCLVALKAYLTKNWKILCIVSTVPYIFVPLFWKFVPESVQWLLIHGKKDELMATVKRISYWNKTDMPTDVTIVPSIENEVEEGHKSSPFDIFGKKRVFQTLLQAFVWLVTGIAYFGISMAADDLGGSPYRDFVILSIFEVPALALAIEFCTRFGRKPSTLISLFVGGLACIVVVTIPLVGKIKVLRVLFGIFGKFSMAVTFNSICTWSVEIFPTSMRSEGMGFLHAIAHIGSASAPWIAQGLRPVARWLPFVMLGAPALVGAVCGIWLPETKATSPSILVNDEETCSVSSEAKGGDEKSETKINCYDNRGAATIVEDEKV